jgi:hypothetical protein
MLGNIDPDGVIDDLADTCWQWVKQAPSVDEENLASKWKVGEHKLNETDTLLIEDERCEDGRFWKMQRSEWGKEDPGVQYENYIFIVRDGKRIEFSLLQDIVHQHERIGPSGTNVYPPYVIREIMNDYDCNMGKDSMSPNWTLVSPANVPNLMESIVSPSRVTPIVLMSKRWDTKQSIVARPGSLSGRLAGLAQVFLLGDPNTRQFGELFGQQWVSNGTIRIYWPGATPESISSEHAWEDMYSKRKFEDRYNSDEVSLRQDIINRICMATATLPASSNLVKSIRSRIEDERRKGEQAEHEEQREEILGELISAEEMVSYLEQENKRNSGEIGSLKIELERKDAEIEDTKEEVQSLRFQISKLRDKNSGFQAVERAIQEANKRSPEGGNEAFMEYLENYGKEEEEPEPEPEFKNLKEVINTARSVLTRLTFLDTAINSSTKTSSDADPAEVYEIFRMLNDEFWPRIKKATEQERLSGKNRLNIHQELNGWLGGKFAERESNETMEMVSGKYNPNGRWFPIDKTTIIKIEPHVKLGSKANPLRIHILCLHAKSKYSVSQTYILKNGKKARRKPKKAINHFPAIIIGWCGNHLPTSTSK